MARLSHNTALLRVFTLFAATAAVSDSGVEQRWYLGCYDWSSLRVSVGLYQAPDGQTHNPALCAKLCLDEGNSFQNNETVNLEGSAVNSLVEEIHWSKTYGIAVLSSQLCYCSHQTEWFLERWHKNRSESVSGADDLTSRQSSTKCESCDGGVVSGSEGLPENAPHISPSPQCPNRCSGSLCLPYAGKLGGVAVYQALGPYIHNVSLSVIAERVQTGKPFLLQVSGNLASPLWQPTGIQGLRAENFSLIGIVFRWIPGAQSTQNATALDDGFFTLSPAWTLPNPGTYHINVTASNGISTQSASLEVTAFRPGPTALEVTVLQGPQDTPSCAPFPTEGTEALEKVFLGATTRLRAFVATGVGLDFFWLFADDAYSQHSGANIHPLSQCLTSTVNHTFEEEGIHAVTVNVSNIYGWIQKTIHIAVVRRALSNLTLEARSGHALTVGQDSSLELEVFTTARQLLSFNITLEPGFTHTHRPGDGSSGPQAPSHLRLVHTYGPHSCLLRSRLVHRYSAAGRFPVSIAVFSSVAVVRACLLRPLQVYELIHDLRPAPPWSAAVRSGVDHTLGVVSRADRTGSVLLWTISRENATVVSRTSEGWSLTLSLRDAGQYHVHVRASNPISSASFHAPLLVQEALAGLSLSRLGPEYIQTGFPVTLRAATAAGTNVTYVWRFGAHRGPATTSGTATHVFNQPGAYPVTVTAENDVSQALSDAIELIVQDPVGGLAVRTPSTATVKQKSVMSFSVMTGTNVTIIVFANESVVYTNDSYVAGDQVMLGLALEQTGTVWLMVRAHNRVSSVNSTTCSLVVQELCMITIDQLQPPVVGENIILIAKVNGLLRPNRNYLYSWTLPHNRTVCSGSPVVSLKCEEPGTHLVNVTVTDSASRISTGALLNVTVLGAAPLLSHPAIAAVGSSVQFSLKNCSPGRSIEVNFGDGNKTTVSYSSAEFSFSYEYPLAGLYHITVVLDNAEILASVIEAQGPVEGLFLMGPEYFSLPVRQRVPSVLTWEATVAQGSNYIYRWKLSNGKENISSIGSDQFTVEVSEPAQLRVEVTVENEVSRLSATLSTSVLYPIAGVSLGAAPTVLGRASLVVLTVAPRQEYALLLDFGDGHKAHSPSAERTPATDCSSSPLCSVTFSFLHTYAHPGEFLLTARVSNGLGVVTETAAAAVEEPIGGVLLVLATPAVIRRSDFINVTASVRTGSDVTFQWNISLLEYSVHSHTDCNTTASFLRYQARVPGTYNVSVTISSPLHTKPLGQHLSVKVCGPIGSVEAQFPSGLDSTALLPQPNGSYSTQELKFSAYTTSADVTFTFSFGDGTPALRVKGASHKVYLGAWSSSYHRFTKEGTFFIRVTAYNEFYNASAQQRLFYVEKMPSDLHLTTNSSVVHKDDIILFTAHLAHGTTVAYTWNMGDQTTYVNRGHMVCHLFLTAAVYNVTVTAQNRVGSVAASTSISVLHQIQPVGIYTDKRVYAAGTDITFLAVTDEPGTLEFLWHFGDRAPRRTTSRSITKRYYFPDRYNVLVNASNGLSCFTSDVHPIIIQREVQANRLLHGASVLLNTSASFDCRINRGTDVTYHWNFGDGTNRTGRNTEQHVFHRAGEFTVEVTVLNLVSSASLVGQIFVVLRPCRPPPVKNMGPLKMQVPRYQALRLGVTYEADIQCNISQGLLYSWALYEAGGQQVLLPPIETHQQSIELPIGFLHYGMYTAIARVQIQGSVVYSNYTVRFEVVPSPPVSLISGGTNIFITNGNSTVLTLSGRQSYDPDYPQNTLSYSWECKPVSVIRSPCFDQHVPTASSVIMFPAGFLRPKFDQFQFTLTVRSGDRTSTSEVFVTVSPKLTRRVQVDCYPCKGSTVNWNEQFSIKAYCEDCDISPRNIFYTWKLYLVNASSKVIVNVPFCRSVDLSLPSKIEGPGYVSPPAVALPLEPPETTSGTPSATSSTNAAVPSPDSLPTPLTSPGASTVPAFPDTPWRPEHAAIVTSSSTNVSAMMIPMTTREPAPPTTFPLFPAFPLPFPEESQAPGARARREAPPEPPGPEAGSGYIPPAQSASGDYDTPLPPYYIPEFPVFSYDGSVGYMGPIGESDIADEFPIDPDFPPIFESSDVIGRPASPWSEDSVGPGFNRTVTDKEGGTAVSHALGFNFTGYEAYHSGIKEADTSAVRPTGLGSGSSSGGDAITAPGGREGDNLVDPSTLLRTPPEKTLLDLDRELIDPAVFQTFTLTGASSPSVTFNPFTLKAGSLYMLEVSATDAQQTLLGKTQFFFSTNEAPRGMTCQVQPSRGYEIHTDFSVFCTSGKEDLLYEYSFSIGGSPRKILYQGRDLQHYFNLPSGDPEDGYKVVIYTEIRNRFGAATKPCEAIVTVLPSFQRNASSVHSPDAELYAYGVRNLANLVQTGNGREIRNYVVLVTGVLNRLSLDPAASPELRAATRSALISTVCQLTVPDQGTMVDNINMLMELMSFNEQVTVESARLVTGHIQDISAGFCEPGVPVTYFLDEWTVKALVSILSRALEASFSPNAKGIQLMIDGIRTTTDLLLKYVLFTKAPEFSVSTSLMELSTRRHASFRNAISSVGSTSVYLPDALDAHTFGSGGTIAEPRISCVASQLTVFKRDPYFWGSAPAQIIGDVADLTLYNCTTRREIKVRSLSAPIIIEFQKRARKGRSDADFSLLRSQVNTHRFNVTPENLQEALQITVELTRPTNQTFPIMLLFRMFEKPTPSLHSALRIYRWETNMVHIFLPPSSLNEAGTGYLSLLNADYNRTLRNKYISSAVNYTLRIECVRCLSWDGARAWRPDGCTPVQGASSNKVNCSCNHLTTFAVAYRDIQSHHECNNVSEFIIDLENLTLCSVVVISLTVYFLVGIVCKRADIQGQKTGGSVLLQDNCPSDQQLYTVTIDTGLRSRPAMTAKVHIVLHGEDGASQTRELNSPGCFPFGRNSRRTFILSTPESLGPIWKVHLWHNNGGPSPSWYLSHVVVRDLAKGSSWFFLGECWLAVDEGDGSVERELTPLTQGLGFRKLLYLKLTEYLEDFHSWASVYSRPSDSRFSHSQRLSVCLLLLEGYVCVCTLLISLQGEQRSEEPGFVDVWAVSLATGVFSALAVLPVGGLVSLLFRLSEPTSDKDFVAEQLKTRTPSIYSVEAHSDALLVDDSLFESYLTWHHLQRWAQDAWRAKCQRGVLDGPFPSGMSEPYSEPCDSKGGWSSGGCGNGGSDRTLPHRDFKRRQLNLQSGCTAEHGCVLEQQVFGSRDIALPSWCRYMAWALCLSLSLTCIVVTGFLGMKFSPTKSLLWIHSLFFSLLCCVFVVQPALILTVAVAVSLWYKESSDFYCGSDSAGPVGRQLKHWSHNGGHLSALSPVTPYPHSRDHGTQFDRVLAARQRARHLRLARPPAPAELRAARDRLKRETLVHRTLREAMLCSAMLSLLLFVAYGRSSSGQCQLNQAVRSAFTRSPRSLFHAIRTHDDWWNWTLTGLLDGLYWDTWYNKVSTNSKASAVQGTCVLIGEPTLKKMEAENKTFCKVPSPFEGLGPEYVPAYSPRDVDSSRSDPAADRYGGAGAGVGLGRSRIEASVRLRALWGRGWLDGHAHAVLVQFTLFNPPTSLFIAVSLLVERTPAGGLLPLAAVESARVYRTAGPLRYAALACELLFLSFTLLQLCFQIHTMSRKGLLAYWRGTRNWLEITTVIISLFYCICCVRHFLLTMEVIDHMQRENFKAFVDLGVISSWEQLIRCLCGTLVFLLLVKCVFVLQTNGVMAPSVTLLKLSLRKLLWPLVAGVIPLIAFASLGNLLFLSSSRLFSSPTRSLQTVVTHYAGVGQLKTLSAHYRPNNLSVALFRGSLSFSVSIVWAALIIGALTSIARSAKKSSRGKHHVTFSDVASYAQNKLLAFLGRRERRWREDHAQRSNFYLDEFEDLVDELLFRLNALSDSLHHTLPGKEPRHGKEETPPTARSDCTCGPGSEHTAAVGESVGKKTWKIDGMIFKNRDMYNLLLSSEEDSLGQNHLRSKLELGILLHLQQNQRKNPTRTCSKDSVVSSGPQHIEQPERASTGSDVEALDSLTIPFPRSDHYDLARLGDDLPHVLCGTRCPEKRAVHSSAAESRTSHSAMRPSAKNRKPLRRSRATVIPLGATRGGGLSARGELEAESTQSVDPVQTQRHHH